MEFKSGINFLLLLLLAVGPAYTKAQHCTFENEAVCIVALNDTLVQDAELVQVLLVDSMGVPIVLDLDSCTYCQRFLSQAENPKSTLLGPLELKFKQVQAYKKKERHTTLLRRSILDKKDYVLFACGDQIEDVFKRCGKVNLQIRISGKKTVQQLINRPLSLSDFHIACTASTFWTSEDKLKEVRVEINPNMF
jgi:hypothetical protein